MYIHSQNLVGSSWGKISTLHYMAVLDQIFNLAYSVFQLELKEIRILILFEPY